MKGIWYHEQDCMEASTYYLSVAANEGSQLGLFLYAIHLRHGWGVVRDEAAAVRILVRTAEAAVGEHHRQSKLGHKTTRIRRIAAEELSFALFELSQCFRQGWGVKRDRDTGLYYLRVAAQLGDMDAQLEMGEVYLRGSDGVRADKKKAAQMFRLALAQGAEVPGMHWVYKEKYNNDVVY
ncbi:hypothetical protein BC829DRAFT_373920 [Chytridium lagenaria]|nr:hypothetical protein BC829DRAFT_373920 [Chytridium lagenaria]